jgi:hypothetical protein
MTLLTIEPQTTLQTNLESSKEDYKNKSGVQETPTKRQATKLKRECL